MKRGARSVQCQVGVTRIHATKDGQSSITMSESWLILHQQNVKLVSGFRWFFGVLGVMEKPWNLKTSPEKNTAWHQQNGKHLFRLATARKMWGEKS